MLDDSKDAPNSQQPPAKWVSTAAAAAALGVSERAVQKWCSIGKLVARRVQATRGEKWEIEAASVENQARTRPNAESEQAERKPEREAEQPERKRANKPNHAQNKPEQDGEREAEQAEPFGLHQLRADIERERQERQHDREEIQFLRGVVESDRRDMAELRAALRKALDSAPRQLTAGTPAPGDEPARIEVSGPETTTGRDEPTTYGELAEWLEKEMG